jgi:hypothetical protein
MKVTFAGDEEIIFIAIIFIKRNILLSFFYYHDSFHFLPLEIYIPTDVATKDIETRDIEF